MPIEPKMFVCRQGHEFVVYVPRAGEMTSRGTPQHRVSGCEGCDMAVEAAYAYCMGKQHAPASADTPEDGASRD